MIEYLWDYCEYLHSESEIRLNDYRFADRTFLVGYANLLRRPLQRRGRDRRSLARPSGL
jgi:hypothetical protein